MIAGRLRSDIAVGGLLRLAEADGGFGAVVARGERESGAILLLISERGRPALLLERVLQATDVYGWVVALRHREGDQNDNRFDKFLHRRRQFDPDCWILELDVASAERLTAQIIALN